ncbi:GNAT family N-acetyltransferase [Paenibacillus sp. TRM 82003]|uniref:GNAT family N-acetyltransferase n=1 Tax=Kineococcus sp. TRM81007 TaxID=2925831 RepID=UPI001F577797|nr:GNAT family N-acetyltransferase [Kineococcus sp. TRM81007]MCI2240343.1 GNAT family N-acetyltransferase [Kineococcus sp. TRM81007]MCI3927480.1 GNAT family N-acetyltransferase [Paenibacillus sp. TRM 82003]
MSTPVLGTTPVPVRVPPGRREVGGLPGTDRVEGAAAVGAVLPEADALAADLGQPVTARLPWWRARLSVRPAAAPWAVLVRDAAGRPRAAAVLVDELSPAAPGERRSTLAAGGDGYLAGVAAATADDARALGCALTAGAASRGTRLELEDLPDDAVTRALAAGAGAGVHPLAAVPFVRRPADGDPLDLLSHGTRKTLRKSRNRIAADGLTVRLSFTSAPAALEELLPDLEVAHRDRDDAHGLPCVLSTPAGRAAWQARARELASAGALEVASLHLDGELAAYVLGVRDGERHGVLEGRFRTRFARYAPGRLLEAAVLRRALLTDGVQLLDWMTGVAPETLLAADGAAARVAVRRP